MDLIKDLEAIVGQKNVSSKQNDIKPYLTDESLLHEGWADVVTYPANTEEVSKIVKYCNENDLPVVPVSSATHLYGSSIPKQGGVIVDLKRMNKVHEIDLINRCVRFDAGVTWKQLTEALEEKNMRIILPLAPHSNRSVATDHLEREVHTNMVYDYGEPMQSVEVVFPNGDIFRTGSASVNGFPDSPSRGANPSGPGLDFYRLLQCAQGTMGIVTWMSLKIQSIPRIDKVLFAPVDDMDYAMKFLYRILPRRIGQECLLLNNVDLAALTSDNRTQFEEYKSKMPKWTLVLVISGLLRRPEEKIAYEEHFLEDVIRNEFPDISLTAALPGFPGIDKKMLNIFRKPWSEEKVYWKNTVKGNWHDVFFITKPEKASEFIRVMREVAEKRGYLYGELGAYIQPIEHNRACQIQFTFYYDKSSEEDCKMVDEISFEAFIALHKAGGYFTRPYGKLSPVLYDGAASYTMALKRVKNIFDPKNVMNPGNLCF